MSDNALPSKIETIKGFEIRKIRVEELPKFSGAILSILDGELKDTDFKDVKTFLPSLLNSAPDILTSFLNIFNPKEKEIETQQMDLEDVLEILEKIFEKNSGLLTRFFGIAEKLPKLLKAQKEQVSARQ